tara:strand:- start:469 stop:1968 length:1500 start_codon:yes stop_codon:yes gene_type:complete
MKNSTHLILLLSIIGVAWSHSALADGDKASAGHDAFIKGLREMDETKLVAGVEIESASEPRSLSPVVSRFKGWFIDVTEKAKETELEGVAVADGISLASKARDSSYWQFVETKNGYLVAATGGKYKGWVIGRDDTAKTRPEGPHLTVVPALRLSKKVTKNCYWDLILTKQGLVLKARDGKYKGWVWDFGGGDPSHKESGREVAVNVLLAERVVAGSYFAVNAKPIAPAKSKGKRVFFTGHSFFIAGGYMAKKVDLIAKAAGKEKHELVGWRFSGGRSGAVDKWWEKGADQEPRKSVAAGNVDILTVCTYWMEKGSEQERCVRNFVKLMQESNPDGLVYLITTKIPFDGKYKDKGGWNARTKAELAELSGWIDETHRYQYHYNGLVDELNKAYGKTVIKTVPLYYGQALLRIQIIDGKVPGVKEQSELYSDAMGHVSELGQRLNAYTVFAAIYGESPVGLHVPEWEKSGDTVLRAQGLSLQKAAWVAVQAVPVALERKDY